MIKMLDSSKNPNLQYTQNYAQNYTQNYAQDYTQNYTQNYKKEKMAKVIT